ncbi:MAG: hypothetical protein RLZ51_23, partial [Pseudomonadota bacterium]
MSSLLRRLYQRLRLANRRRLYRRNASKATSYAHWLTSHDTLGEAQLDSLRARLELLQERPKISVLMPTFNPTREWFERAVDSVRRQLYPNWELCIADDASDRPWLTARLAELQQEDPRIRAVRREVNGHICAATNSALALATGDWIALLDHDDELREHALLLIAETACASPQAGMIYSDEDKLDELGQRCWPHFKPGWNYDLCLSNNYVCHLLAVKTVLVRQLGGMRPGFEGAQDHDLVLRVSEHLKPEQIRHIPQVLYHWRMHEQSTAKGGEIKPYAFEAGRRCVEDHLHRLGYAVRVETLASGRYRVHWTLPSPPPLVSILIPTRNQAGLLKTCLESLKAITDYPSYEILIIDNGSDAPDALALLEHWSRQPQVRVIRDDSPFNYSALNNRAARQAQGSVLVLMNNDIEILHSDWLHEMVSQACRPGVGAVGAKLLYPDRTVQHAGVVLGMSPDSPMGGVAGHAHRGIPGEAEGYMNRAAVAQRFSAVTAACLTILRSRFDAVGGFEEENLAVAFNDVDLCLRLEDIGLINVWTPFAMLVHHESVSRGKDKQPKNRERYLGERAYMLRRWGARLTM